MVTIAPGQCSVVGIVFLHISPTVLDKSILSPLLGLRVVESASSPLGEMKIPSFMFYRCAQYRSHSRRQMMAWHFYFFISTTLKFDLFVGSGIVTSFAPLQLL